MLHLCSNTNGKHGQIIVLFYDFSVEDKILLNICKCINLFIKFKPMSS